MKVAMPMVNDFELVEMTAVVDLLRRAKIELDIISVFNEDTIISSNKVKMFVDKKLEDVNLDEYDMIVLTGGMGTNAYYNSAILIETLKSFNEKNKKIAAICAAPTVLANIGVLAGKKATVFPACSEELIKNDVKIDGIGVTLDANILSASSVNYAMDFGLKIVEILLGTEKRLDLEKEIVRI